MCIDETQRSSRSSVTQVYINCLFRVQRQVHGVMGIVKDNISKVLDRGEKLTDLQEKSGEYVYIPHVPCRLMNDASTSTPYL